MSKLEFTNLKSVREGVGTSIAMQTLRWLRYAQNSDIAFPLSQQPLGFNLIKSDAITPHLINSVRQLETPYSRLINSRNFRLIEIFGPPDSGKSSTWKHVGQRGHTSLWGVPEFEGKLRRIYNTLRSLQSGQKIMFWPAEFKALTQAWMLRAMAISDNPLVNLRYGPPYRNYLMDGGPLDLLAWSRFLVKTHWDEMSSEDIDIVGRAAFISLVNSKFVARAFYLPAPFEEVRRRREKEGWDGSFFGEDIWPEITAAYEWVMTIAAPIIYGNKADEITTPVANYERPGQNSVIILNMLEREGFI